MSEGFEYLKEELYKAGFNVSKVNSNVELIMAVVKIMTTDEGQRVAYEKAAEDLRRAQEYHRLADRKYTDADNVSYRNDMKMREIEKATRQLEELQEETKAKQEELQNALEHLETPEARDSLRLAVLFKQDTRGKCRTDQNNTAYIHGLGQIYAGCKNELQRNTSGKPGNKEE